MIFTKKSILECIPCDKHASTAPHNEVTDPLSSCTNFLVTDSSITCLTSFLTAAMRRPLNSFSTIPSNILSIGY